MSNVRLTLKLVGSPEDDGYVHLDEFAAFCESVLKCLRRSESIVSGGSANVKYRITDMRCESASVTVEPIKKSRDIEVSKPAMKFFRDAIAGIQSGKIDPRIKPDDLQAFRELTAPLGKNSRKVLIGRRRLTSKYTINIDKLLKSDIISQGTISGLLERLNVHGKNEFVVYPEGSTENVPCVFGELLLESVKDAIKRNVTVRGTLYFRKSSPYPSRVHVESLEIHPGNNDLPSLHDVQSLGIWDTGGLSALEFVRSIRDE